jgi:hypothetical protein
MADSTSKKVRGRMTIHIFGQFVHEGILAGLLAVAGGIAMWPIRKVSGAYQEFTGKLDGISKELSTQRTNCLATLQGQGDKQIELLSKTVDTLDGVRLDLREQTGYLRAAAPAPALQRVRAGAKRK